MFLEKFANAFTAFLEASFDIPTHSGGGRNFDVRAPCYEQFFKLAVIDNIRWPVVFSDPLDKSGPRENDEHVVRLINSTHTGLLGCCASDVSIEQVSALVVQIA